MGFLPTDKKAPTQSVGGLSKEFMARMGCKVCPLQSGEGCRHPQLEPTGNDETGGVYILGGIADKPSDRAGQHFAGNGGDVLQLRMPEALEREARYNYVVRTRPPDGRDPMPVEIECCRASVVKDIERHKPRAIITLGNLPLKWATGYSRPDAWAGRRVPVQIGAHKTWLFPMIDPEQAFERRRWEPRDETDFTSDDEFKLALDLRNAAAALDNLPEPIIHTEAQAIADIELVLDGDIGRLRDYIDEALEAKRTGFDYETNRLRPYSKGAKLLTAALSHAGRTFAFPLDHPGHKWTGGDRAKAHDLVCKFIEHAKGRKIVHNLAFELEWSCVMYGTEYARAGRWDCSASQAYVLDERVQLTKPDCLSLEFLCMQYFGIDLKAISNLDRKRLEQAPVADVCRYNALDSRYHRLLFNEQHKRLRADKLSAVYERHLLRVPTAVLTQIKGVPIDAERVAELDEQFSKALRKLEREIEATSGYAAFARRVGRPYSVSNPRDMLLYLRDIKKRRDATSADAKALTGIDDDLCKLTLKWREQAKQHSTYVVPVLESSEHVQKGLLHPELHTMKVVTWRTSSSDPNVQNWPKRKSKTARSQVRPGRNRRVVSFDFAGIQARNVAMESKDKALIQAFWKNYDIHTDWMERIQRQVPTWMSRADRADKDRVKFFRNEAKNKLVFPSFFGARPKKVASELRIELDDAEALHEEFWSEFPDIRGWHEHLAEFYHAHGYVTGLTGFRRRAPITPNMLINAPIQADESEIVLDAMTRLSMIDFRYQANMEIHDDLTFIWDARDVDTNAEVVVREMLGCKFPWINVPLQVEMLVGDDWASQKEVGVFVSKAGGGYKELTK